MKMSLLTALFLTIGLIGNSTASELNQNESSKITTPMLDEIVDFQSNTKIENGFNFKNLHKANLSCGLAPLPPLGCVIGSCVCDQNGNNCHWQFNCQ